MRTYTDVYGADIDGNRGELRRYYELEPSDRDDILQAIYSQCPEVLDEEPVGGTVDITLICPITEESIEFTINLEEWL